MWQGGAAAVCSVGGAAGPRIVQVTRCGEVRGGEGICAQGICAGAPRELGLVELEDPLEQREHVRRQLARERACELSLVGVGVLRPPLHREVIAQHVRSEGEEAVLSGGGDLGLGLGLGLGSPARPRAPNAAPPAPWWLGLG